MRRGADEEACDMISIPFFGANLHEMVYRIKLETALDAGPMPPWQSAPPTTMDAK
jgi:hypothetical protein